MRGTSALTCCTSHSRDFLLKLLQRLVSRPDRATVICDGKGVTISVAAEDMPLLSGENNRMLASLNTVHRAIVGRPESVVSLQA